MWLEWIEVLSADMLSEKVFPTGLWSVKSVCFQISAKHYRCCHCLHCTNWRRSPTWQWDNDHRVSVDLTWPCHARRELTSSSSGSSSCSDGSSSSGSSSCSDGSSSSGSSRHHHHRPCCHHCYHHRCCLALRREECQIFQGKDWAHHSCPWSDRFDIPPSSEKGGVSNLPLSVLSVRIPLILH